MSSLISAHEHCIYLKPGTPRTVDDTAQQIREQLRLATLSGATDKLKAATSENGVRDSSTASAVNFVVEMGKLLRKPQTGPRTRSEVEIREILEKEMEEQLKKGDINPLIGMPGTFDLFLSVHCLS